MGYFKELFTRGVDLKALKLKLRGVERERRKHFLTLRKLGAKQEQLVEEVKKARRLGNQFQVDYIWEDLKALKHDMAFARRSAKVSNLEGITLKRWILGFERLERSKDKSSIQNIIGRIQNSGLEAKLAAAEINEEEYLDELNGIIDSMGLEDMYQETSENDPEKSRFLAEIDAINEAEEGGEFDTALKREREIKKLLEKDELTP